MVRRQDVHEAAELARKGWPNRLFIRFDEEPKVYFVNNQGPYHSIREMLASRDTLFQMVVPEGWEAVVFPADVVNRVFLGDYVLTRDGRVGVVLKLNTDDWSAPLDQSATITVAFHNEPSSQIRGDDLFQVWPNGVYADLLDALKAKREPYGSKFVGEGA